MNWRTFIANLVSSIAWPATTIILVILLRAKVYELIPALAHLKFGGLEAEFVALSKETKEKDLYPRREYKTADREVLATRLGKLASISPRSAILEAFTELEIAARAVAQKVDPSGSYEHARIFDVITALVGKPLIGDQITQLFKLSKLRNEVAHTNTFKVSEMLVQEYIDICLSITDILRQYLAKPKILEAAPE
jgi:hypothetical protein